MKYSYNWLKEHLEGELPDIATVMREVTLRAFEVEEVEEKESDTLLEIKVLPDRAHDALSHRGMAREIGALLGVSRQPQRHGEAARDVRVESVGVVVEEKTLCPRYIATRINNVSVGKTPEGIAAKLESVGGRSINNIVDITNYVLFDIGQPLHAFDTAKVVGGIMVRLAKSGETMTTLDNKALTFDGTELVIADDEGVLALAGIKGGKKAEVTNTTTSIILESANFDPTLTRKTSQKHNIKTDASKRYENGMTSAFAKEGCDMALALLQEHGGSGVQIGATTDAYSTPESPVSVSVTLPDINRLLGLMLGGAELSGVLTRAGHMFTQEGDNFTVTIPEERLDLRIKEDMIEEVGRHIGYEKIVPVLPKLPRKGVPHKRMYYANKVRKFLVERGFSEVITYSFAPKGEGEVEVINPVGNDRPFMRTSLVPGIERALRSNFYNAPLLELEDMKIFEIGNVFAASGERTLLALGAMGGTKKRWKSLQDELKTTYEMLADLLHAEKNILPLPGEQSGIIQVDFDGMISALPEPKAYDVLLEEEKVIRYQKLSAYPFIVRDIAIFVPQEVGEAYIETLLKKEAGDLLMRFSQFDKFQKQGESRISYAYRMVFQSFERTLTDEEVGGIMEHVTAACNKENNWQVR